MNSEGSVDNPAVARPSSKEAVEIRGNVARRLISSRNAVLNGWIISMLGIVLYCFAMLSGGEPDDPFSSILERGWMGAGAIAFLLVGVLLWFYGAMTFLGEVENNTPDACAAPHSDPEQGSATDLRDSP
jgi:hypothetical protein